VSNRGCGGTPPPGSVCSVLECTCSVQETGVDPTFRTAIVHPESGIRLGLVRFSFKELGRYFRNVSGVVEMCGCGRSGLGSDVETQIGLSLKESHILLGLVFPQNNYWLAFGLSSPSSLASSQLFYQSKIVSESPQSHPTASSPHLSYTLPHK